MELYSVTSTQLAKAAYDGFYYNAPCVDPFEKLNKDDQKAWYYAAANVKDLLQAKENYWKDKDWFNSDNSGPNGL